MTKFFCLSTLVLIGFVFGHTASASKPNIDGSTLTFIQPCDSPDIKIEFPVELPPPSIPEKSMTGSSIGTSIHFDW